MAARGSGKSNLAAVLAEQMFDAGLPFVVVDPVGSWFGLRAGADGQKNGGLAIPIFGGKHGDVPLERGGGELLADLVVSKRLSCVLDLSAFESESAKKAFLLAFAQRLYLKNTDPLHLFLEEADDYIPQRPMRDEAQLLRAWENIVRRGRSRGLGMTLITQRSASLNKSVLTQVQTLFVLRTTGPQDRAAIEAWVKYHDTDDKLLSSLSALGPGEGWVWSPQFLERMSKHQFHRRRTFDSGATPKNLRGKDARAAATLADVDLPEIHAQMAATIERAKADDPKELKKTVADLRAQLSKAAHNMHAKGQPAAEPKRVEALTDADRRLMHELADRLDGMVVALSSALNTDELKGAMSAVIAQFDDRRQKSQAELFKLLEGKRLVALRQKVEASVHSQLTRQPQREPDVRTGTSPAVQAVPARQPGRSGDGARSAGQGSDEMTPAMRGPLVVLANNPHGCTIGKLALLSGKRISGGFRNILAALRTNGWIEGQNTGVMTITEAGRKALGSYDELPTGDALGRYWLGNPMITPAARDILGLLLTHRKGLDIATLADRLNKQVSGGFRNLLSELRTAGVIVGKNTETMRASEELFS